MTSTLALASLIGLALSADGAAVHVDKGLLHGLRPGDTGRVFYMLTVGGRQIRVDVASGSVTTITDRDSTLLLPKPLSGISGYRVEFDLSESRLAAAYLLSTAQSRLQEGKLAEALGLLRALQTSIPTDPILLRLLKEAESTRREQMPRQEGLSRTGSSPTPSPLIAKERDAASGALDPGAEQPVSKGNPDITGPETSSATTSFSEMLLVPGGAHEIGANLKDAGTYNQHPKFRVYLRTFWIDRTPVIRPPQPRVEMNVKLQTGKRSGAGAGVAFSDAQAYCESQNKRLPTEFEWEVGSGQPGFAVTPGLLEWTVSPYEPYPGNVIWEPEYEQNLLVLRGVRAHQTLDVRGRFFLSPTRTMSKVGFRCVRDTATQ